MRPLRSLCLLLLAVVGATGLAHAQDAAPPETGATLPVPLEDGPYLRRTDAGIEARWVCDGNVIERTVPVVAARAIIAPECGYHRPIHVQPPASTAPSTLTGIPRLIALSDVHGQHDLMVKLLQAHGIIDEALDWRWGDGHLVMTGDVFDRGDRVTETFWLLYELEQQARAAGGGLHFLIGNHEAMVLQGDLRYLHEKYPQISERLGRSVPDLHGADSVLGQWLRSKAVMLKVDDALFLHGGIHFNYLALGLNLDKANATFRASLDWPRERIKADPTLAVLYGSDGPLWYRGYFLEPLLGRADVDDIARRLGVQRIVVGHTSMTEVGSYHGGRVIAIDSSIKNGESGELLFMENGALSRGTVTGERFALPMD